MKLDDALKGVTQEVRKQVPAEVFAALDGAAARLAASGVIDKPLKRGQRIPDFELADALGNRVDSRTLLGKGPLVISFYRGAWCPYCNLALNSLQQHLQQIQARGATLVAISPEKPDHSLSLKEKHALAFPVLSDPHNKVARKFGLVFTLEESLRPIYKSFGIDLPAHNGDDSFELPVPATYVVGADGVVVEAFVDVDYRKRAEPETILSWLDRMRVKQRA